MNYSRNVQRCSHGSSTLIMHRTRIIPSCIGRVHLERSEVFGSVYVQKGIVHVGGDLWTLSCVVTPAMFTLFLITLHYLNFTDPSWSGFMICGRSRCARTLVAICWTAL